MRRHGGQSVPLLLVVGGSHGQLEDLPVLLGRVGDHVAEELGVLLDDEVPLLGDHGDDARLEVPARNKGS